MDSFYSKVDLTFKVGLYLIIIYLCVILIWKSIDQIIIMQTYKPILKVEKDLFTYQIYADTADQKMALRLSSKHFVYGLNIYLIDGYALEAPSIEDIENASLLGIMLGRKAFYNLEASNLSTVFIFNKKKKQVLETLVFNLRVQ